MIIGIIKNTTESKENVEKETLIQKMKVDLFEEKTKKGRELTQDEKESVIDTYGTIIEENGEKFLKTTQGEYKILLSEIII